MSTQIITSVFVALQLLWPAAPLSAQAGAQNGAGTVAPLNVERVLKGARRERARYFEAFKNLTADETKVTEVFDEKGTLKKRRALVASFLVYQSQADGEKLLEFHVIREVNGEPVRDYVGRTEELFARLVKASTWEGEWKRIHRENTRYRLRYERWGVTLHMAGQLEEASSSGYYYDAMMGEKIDGRETIILSYRRKALDAGEVTGGNDKHIGDRGRLWLDAETFQIRRWENEKLARHEKSRMNYIFMRDEVDYAQSSLGILVPRRIVTEFFDHVKYNSKTKEPPRATIGGRITFTYDSYKRFDVTTREQLDPVIK